MKDLLPVLKWVWEAFWCGFVVLLVYSILEAIFDKYDSLDNMLYRVLLLTVVGGISISIYKTFHTNNE